MDITTKFIQEVHDLENTATLFNEAYTNDKSIFTNELQHNLKTLSARITLFEKLWSRNMRGQLSDIKYFNNLNDYSLNIETTPEMKQEYPRITKKTLQLLTGLHEINEFAIIKNFKNMYQCVVCRTQLLNRNDLSIHANSFTHFYAIRKLIKPLKSYVEYWESNILYYINKYITWTESEAEIYCWGCDIVLPIKAGIIHEHFLSQGHKSTTAYEDLLKTQDIWNKNPEKYFSKRNINLAVFTKYIFLAEKSIVDPITITIPYDTKCLDNLSPAHKEHISQEIKKEMLEETSGLLFNAFQDLSTFHIENGKELRNEKDKHLIKNTQAKSTDKLGKITDSLCHRFESQCSVKQDCQKLSEESTFDDIILQLDDTDYYCLLCSKFHKTNTITVHCSSRKHLAKLSLSSSAHKAKDAHYCTFCKSIFFKFDVFSKHRNQPSHQNINLITQKCPKCQMMFLGTLDKICQHKHFKSIANQLYTRQEEIEQKSSSLSASQQLYDLCKWKFEESFIVEMVNLHPTNEFAIHQAVIFNNCLICKENVEANEYDVLEHLKSPTHIKRLKKRDRINDIKTFLDFISDMLKGDTDYNLLSNIDFIFPSSPSNMICKACNTEIPYHLRKINLHFEMPEHIESCNSITTTFFEKFDFHKTSTHHMKHFIKHIVEINSQFGDKSMFNIKQMLQLENQNHVVEKDINNQQMLNDRNSSSNEVTDNLIATDMPNAHGLMNDQLTTGISKRCIKLNWFKVKKNQLYNKMFFEILSTGVYVCTLCDCTIDISNKNSVQYHIKSEQHTESLIKFSHRYYCYPCDSTIKDLKTYDAHKLQSDHKERLFACQNNIHDKAQFCEKTCDKCGLIIFCDGDTLPEHIHSTFKCLITDVSDSAMDNSVQTKAHNSDEKIELISSFKEKEIIENQIKTSSNFDKNAQPDKINLLSTSGKFETDNEETLCNNSSPASHDDVNQSHITKSTDCMHNKNDTISINNTDSDETLANDVFLHNSDKSSDNANDNILQINEIKCTPKIGEESGLNSTNIKLHMDFCDADSVNSKTIVSNNVDDVQVKIVNNSVHTINADSVDVKDDKIQAKELKKKARDIYQNQFLRKVDNRVGECLLCKCKFSFQARIIEDHFYGKSHQKNLNNLQIRSYCELCKQFIDDYEKHALSEDHVDRVDNFCNEWNITDTKIMRKYNCTECFVTMYIPKYAPFKHIHFSLDLSNVKSRPLGRKQKYARKVECLLYEELFLNEYAANTLKIAERIAQCEERLLATCTMLKKCIQNIYPCCTVYPFGSRISGLAVENSDLDVFVDTGDMYDGSFGQDNEYQEKLVTACTQALEKSIEWENIVAITHARTPIIKAYNIIYEIDCDISFKHGLGVENSAMIKKILDDQPIAKSVILVLKKWLKLIKVTINGYGLSLLVIFYLQQIKLIIPISHMITNEKIINGWSCQIGNYTPYPKTNPKLSEILRGFYEFYAKFNYEDDVICPLIGVSIKKSDFIDFENLPSQFEPYKKHCRKLISDNSTDNDSGSHLNVLDPICNDSLKTDTLFCLQDPIDLSHNVTKGVRLDEFERFHRMCDMSYSIIAAQSCVDQ